MIYCQAASNELIDAAVAPGHSVSLATVFLGTGLGSIIGALISLLVYAIFCFYLPVKLLKGKAQLQDTVSSVGYAWPGIMRVLTLPVSALGLFSDFDSLIRVSLYYLAFAIQILAGIWTLLTPVLP